MDKKKVLNIIYSGTGGHGSVWYALMNGGGLTYWENYAVFYGIEDVLPEYITFCRDNNITYLVLKKKHFLDFKNWFFFFQFVRKNNIDYLLLHQHSIYFAALLIRILGLSKKMIYVEHTPHEILRKVDHFFIPKMFEISDHVVFLNESILKYYESEQPKWAYKMHIIPNGINHEIYQLNYKSYKREGFRIGMISRMTIQKDFETLIRAYKKLCKNGSPIHLLIGGDGPEKNDIMQCIEDEDMQMKVEYLGLLNQKEAIKFYQSLDIFILSTKSEGMPMVILEAMACGIPVIASNVNGCNFIIQDNINGLLFERGNIEELGSKILMLQNDENLRKRIAEAGYRTATQTFTMENMFNNYNNLLV